MKKKLSGEELARKYDAGIAKMVNDGWVENMKRKGNENMQEVYAAYLVALAEGRVDDTTWIGAFGVEYGKARRQSSPEAIAKAIAAINKAAIDKKIS